MTNPNDPAQIGEAWTIIPRLPSYVVSSFGRVRRSRLYNNSHPDGFIKVAPYGNRGYQGVSLCENGKPIRALLHRLVAEAFLGPRADYEVNHIDGNKGNNTLSNLEYVTSEQNVAHAKALKLYRAPNKGKKTGIVPRSAFKPGNVPWNKRAELNKEPKP